MSRKIPDRLSADADSKFHIKDHPLVRISVDGVEYTGLVFEYCISKGWAKIIKTNEKGEAIKVVAGGRPTMKVKHGKVVVWFADDVIPEGALNAEPTIN